MHDPYHYMITRLDETSFINTRGTVTEIKDLWRIYFANVRQLMKNGVTTPDGVQWEMNIFYCRYQICLKLSDYWDEVADSYDEVPGNGPESFQHRIIEGDSTFVSY